MPARSRPDDSSRVAGDLAHSPRGKCGVPWNRGRALVHYQLFPVLKETPPSTPAPLEPLDNRATSKVGRFNHILVHNDVRWKPRRAAMPPGRSSRSNSPVSRSTRRDPAPSSNGDFPRCFSRRGSGFTRKVSRMASRGRDPRVRLTGPFPRRCRFHRRPSGPGPTPRRNGYALLGWSWRPLVLIPPWRLRQTLERLRGAPSSQGPPRSGPGSLGFITRWVRTPPGNSQVDWPEARGDPSFRKKAVAVFKTGLRPRTPATTSSIATRPDLGHLRPSFSGGGSPGGRGAVPPFDPPLQYLTRDFPYTPDPPALVVVYQYSPKTR